jgi:hypothetical protein
LKHHTVATNNKDRRADATALHSPSASMHGHLLLANCQAVSSNPNPVINMFCFDLFAFSCWCHPSHPCAPSSASVHLPRPRSHPLLADPKLSQQIK